jgi:16S rRNA (uracil1498-N3)-methyltransferase
MRRFFIPSDNIDGDSAVVTGSDVHHIVSVLRQKEGDVIDATDGAGNLLTVKLSKIENSIIHMEVISRTEANERKKNVRLYQAVPKGSKFDWIVEKACELGANEIYPVITERTVQRMSEERGLKKIARWERIAFETMKQVGRSSKMAIRHAIEFSDVSKHLNAFSLKIVPWELEEEMKLKDYLQNYKDVQDIEIFIGPEGGISLHEIDELKAWGFQSVSLGSRILKAETAAIVTLGNIYFELEN